MAKTVPDFSTIIFLPTGEQAKTTNSAADVDLSKFFDAVINHWQLEVDEQQLELMLSKDLSIDIKTLDKRLVGVLAEALVYYMTVWPGWQRAAEYYKGQLTHKEWFDRFRQYLIFKSNFIIKNAEKFDSEPPAQTSTTDVAVQTTTTEIENMRRKQVAPYVLTVGGPPSVLNNIVFMESNGSILIKQHMEKPWVALKLNEFLNWLHVSVEVHLPDISITRSNTHNFERYIALCGDLTVLPDVNFISYIKKTKPNAEMQPYTYEFFQCYLQQFFRTVDKISGINSYRLQLLKAIFIEFLADIKEVNVYNCTMCTDISVGYHIGKCKYIRNKKMVSSDPKKKNNEQTTINFYEILLPHVDFTLHHFKAVQDVNQSNVTFESLNKLITLLSTNSNHEDIQNLRNMVNQTCLVYKCTLCSESFSNANAHLKLTKHFSEHHKAEQSLLCFRCRREFSVQALAGQRWKHVCADPKKKY